jgi:hypothetical protein
MDKDRIERVIKELIDYSEKIDFNFGEFKNYKYFLTFKQFLFEQKLEEVLNELIDNDTIDYKIDSIVFEDNSFSDFQESELLLEWEQYKKIPKTNLTYRFDSENTNTKTDDHIHVLQGNNQLYAINKDGSPHDGSKARLGKKEIKFLKSLGFTPPKDGILEWITLPKQKNYVAFRYYLLFD